VAIREIIQYPDEILTQVSKPVESFNKELKELVSDMIATMYAAPGIGLAAIQIGIPKSVIVFDCSEAGNSPQSLINPKIIKATGEINSEEGCLSIPGYRETIKRSEKVVVSGFDIDGKPVEISADGLLSRCLQHEIDHTEGKLIIDRFSRLKKEMFLKWFQKKNS
jgi:peptide deformylase